MKFCSFASGSAGNCYYIASDNCAILVDAGISARSIRSALKTIEAPLDSIFGIFVTHDHFDHTSGLALMGEKFNLPVYSTKEILDGVNRSIRGGMRLYSCRRFIEKDKSQIVGDMCITPFHLDHDSTDCVGYYIESQGCSLAIATDLGYINETARQYLLKADNIVIEANYSEKMLREGSYPEYLKNRILSSSGHLANHVTASFLADNAERHWKNVFFCHLSNNNNTPSQVLSDMRDAFVQRNMQAEDMPPMYTLPRSHITEIFDL